MNIYEFCEEFKISLGKARKMNKRGVLRLDGDSEAAGEMRHYLGRGQALPAAHLVKLLEEPALLLDLGRYSDKSEQQIAELGARVKDDAAPREIVAYIGDAAKGDAEAVAVLVEWLKEILPAKPVPHAFIAVRLLLGLAPSIRKFDVPRIPRALLNCRRHDDFAGYWRTMPAAGRNITIYSQPAKKDFDL